jgi:hypothetical protein
MANVVRLSPTGIKLAGIAIVLAVFLATCTLILNGWW